MALAQYQHHDGDLPCPWGLLHPDFNAIPFRGTSPVDYRQSMVTPVQGQFVYAAMKRTARENVGILVMVLLPWRWPSFPTTWACPRNGTRLYWGRFVRL